MAGCIAPSQSHRTASGRANCPACGGSYGGYNSYPSYSSQYSSLSNCSTSRSSGGQTKAKVCWASGGSTILYTPAEIRTLTPVRENVEKRLESPDLRDVFFVTLRMTVKTQLRN